MKKIVIKFFKVIFLLFGALYIIICIYMHQQQNELLYFPQTEDSNYSKQFTEHEVVFENDGMTLHGWMQFSQVTVDNPLVIYYGGNGDEASRNLAMLKNLGFNNYLAINYRGYGRSSGEPDELQLKSDALYIFDQITKQYGIDPASIILMGRSLGTGLAAYVSSERQVNKVILVTPYDSLVNVAGSHYPWLPVSLLLNQRFESDVLAPSIDEPVLCLLAENDRIIPPYHGEKLCDLWKGETSVEVIKNSNHNTIKNQPSFYSAIRNFL